MSKTLKYALMGLAAGLVAAGVFVPFGETGESIKDRILSKDEE